MRDKSWTAFLAMSFLVAGLCGVFSCYAAQIPLQREIVHQTALDRLADPTPIDAAEQTQLRDVLHDVLGDLPPALLARPADPQALAAARLAARQDGLRDAADIRFRLVIVNVVIAAAAALFGIMALSVVGKAHTITSG